MAAKRLASNMLSRKTQKENDTVQLQVIFYLTLFFFFF